MNYPYIQGYILIYIKQIISNDDSVFFIALC